MRLRLFNLDCLTITFCYNKCSTDSAVPAVLHCMCWCCCSAVVDAATIDRINILQAAMLAMRTAVEGLAGAGLQADHLLIDGNR